MTPAAAHPARWTLLRLFSLTFALLGPACGGRSSGLPGSDLGTFSEAGNTPTRCSSLALVGKATLEYSDSFKMQLRVVFDGEQFAVTWHTQPAIISSLNGDLRLARVDLTGKASSQDGRLIASDDGQMRHAMLGLPGELVVVHRTGGKVRRLILTPGGTMVRTTPLSGSPWLAAIAPHPDGHALVLVDPPGIPRTTILTRNGAERLGESLITAEVMTSVGLAKGPGDTYAAVLHSTNQNGSLYILDRDLRVKAQNNIGQGALIRSASLAGSDSGSASLYITHERKAKLELYDAKGKDQKRVTLAKATADVQISGQTSLVWTGRQLLAVHLASLPHQYRAHLVEPDGRLTGSSITIPSCLAVAGAQVSTAWGNGHLAVATVNAASGLNKSAVCVTVMKCQ